MRNLKAFGLELILLVAIAGCAGDDESSTAGTSGSTSSVAATGTGGSTNSGTGGMTGTGGANTGGAGGFGGDGAGGGVGGSSLPGIPGTVVLHEDFESGGAGDLRLNNFYFPWSVSFPNVTSNPSNGCNGTGSKVARIELRPTDKNVHNVYRAEFFSAYSNLWDVDKTNWVEWCIYFPPDFDPGPFPGPEALIIGQVHGNGTGPVSTITLRGCQGTSSPLDLCWGVMGKNLSNGGPTPHGITVGGNSNHPFQQQGQWVKLVYQFKASQSGQGIINAWMNGTKIGAMTGDVGTSTTDDPYFKTGLYHRPDTTTVIYMDDITMTTEP